MCTYVCRNKRVYLVFLTSPVFFNEQQHLRGCVYSLKEHFIVIVISRNCSTDRLNTTHISILLDGGFLTNISEDIFPFFLRYLNNMTLNILSSIHQQNYFSCKRLYLDPSDPLECGLQQLLYVHLEPRKSEIASKCLYWLT